jgi:hypothetical protein
MARTGETFRLSGNDSTPPQFKFSQFPTMSAIPQAELDAARAKLTPEQQNFIDWKLEQIDPMQHMLIKDQFARGGANPYLDAAGAQAAIERRPKGAWTDPQWREKLEAERQARAAEQERSRQNPGPFVIGGGTGSNSTGGGGGGGGGANPPVYTPPTDPYNPEPPVPTTPDIADVTTGGSRAAYEYLSGQGPYPTNPYLPEGTPIAKPIFETPGYEMLKPPAPKPLGGVNDPNKMPTEPAGFGKKWEWNAVDKRWNAVPDNIPAPTPSDMSAAATGGLMPKRMALGGLGSLAGGGQAGYNLGGYSDGGRLLRGPGDGVSDSIPATIGRRQPARLADGEFVIPARIVSELGNGSTEAGARKLYAMMDRVQKARGKTTGKNRVAANSRADKHLPA